MWQDPMNDTQQLETRRRIKVVLDALITELKARNLNVKRPDENTLIINGMTFTATDQLSDTYNDVCYLLTDYNQTVEATLSRIDECADTIEELLMVQVEKSFTRMVKNLRNKYIGKNYRKGYAEILQLTKRSLEWVYSFFEEKDNVGDWNRVDSVILERINSLYDGFTLRENVYDDSIEWENTGRFIQFWSLYNTRRMEAREYPIGTIFKLEGDFSGYACVVGYDTRIRDECEQAW